ncbi:MAG: hypothetical protein NC911_02010 [Candidatus Omnitrophica bacterium]|nr:hypothetical protein [Candidatus Omnitrophota bacterium]
MKRLLIEQVAKAEELPVQVQEHLSRCSECQNLLKEVKSILQAVYQDQLPTVSKEYWEQSFKKLNEAVGPVRRVRMVLAFAGALIVVFIGLISFFSAWHFRPILETRYVRESILLPSEEEMYRLVDYLKDEEPEVGLWLLLNN